MSKAFGLDIDRVLYDMSYINVILYGATLPSCGGKAGKDGRAGEIIDGNDPANAALIDRLFDES